jgi:hypothetical protein
MNKLDLIIEAIEFSKLVDNKVHREELLDDALEDLRELRDMKPVAWLHPDKKVDVVVPSSLGWFDKPIPLYAKATGESNES